MNTPNAQGSYPLVVSLGSCICPINDKREAGGERGGGGGEL